MPPRMTSKTCLRILAHYFSLADMLTSLKWFYAAHEPRTIKLIMNDTFHTPRRWNSAVPGQRRHPAIMSCTRESRIEGIKSGYRQIWERAQKIRRVSPDGVEFCFRVKNAHWVNFSSDTFLFDLVRRGRITRIRDYIFNTNTISRIKRLGCEFREAGGIDTLPSAIMTVAPASTLEVIMQSPTHIVDRTLRDCRLMECLDWATSPDRVLPLLKSRLGDSGSVVSVDDWDLTFRWAPAEDGEEDLVPCLAIASESAL